MPRGGKPGSPGRWDRRGERERERVAGPRSGRELSPSHRPGLLPREGTFCGCLRTRKPNCIGCPSAASNLEDSSLVPDYSLTRIFILQIKKTQAVHAGLRQGVGMAMRKMGSVAKPDVYIIKDGDTVTVKTESTFKTSQFSFKLGEKFEENTLDGRKTQTLVSLKDDGSLIQEQGWDGKKTIITRKLVDGQLVVECDMNGVKCIRVYQ
ncbi:PREDICTED: fatty acid-binding protein, epidermal-like, partial [Chaetura pelagica]|uniref:fatty acid-binding protein, epidermal-like n=1 Tax=Chaetura pelagica TaxID=8897 RepID=UPI000523A096